MTSMRFSIRDILLLTVIVAVLTGWGLDRWRLSRRIEELDHQAKLQLVAAEIARADAILQRDQSQVFLQRALLDEAARFYEQQQPESKASTDAQAAVGSVPPSP